MKFYRYTGKDDLWLGKYGKSERTLIPNEILTTSELNSIKSKCPRLNVSKTFKEIDISKNNTYINFGVRFENDTDHNSKLESRRMTIKKAHIKEDYSDTIIVDNFNELSNDCSELLRVLNQLTKRVTDIRDSADSIQDYVNNNEELDDEDIDYLGDISGSYIRTIQNCYDNIMVTPNPLFHVWESLGIIINDYDI